MSSYFDAMSREVAQAAEDAEQNAVFLTALIDIEERLFREVTAITGDREFPEDLREKMLGVLVMQAVYQPGRLSMPRKAVERALCCQSSRAVEDMHDLFHELARRRVETRFGRWNDSPTYNAALRDDHDGGE